MSHSSPSVNGAEPPPTVGATDANLRIPGTWCVATAIVDGKTLAAPSTAETFSAGVGVTLSVATGLDPAEDAGVGTGLIVEVGEAVEAGLTALRVTSLGRSTGGILSRRSIEFGTVADRLVESGLECKARATSEPRRDAVPAFGTMVV